jgi:very-short-patch-repair endonuclease
MAAVLAEPWAVASHRSAARLHELTGFRVGRPEVSIRPGANARGRLAIAHRAVDTLTTNVDGIPCVTKAQVFIDLAPSVSRERLRVALARATDASPSLLDGVRDRYLRLAPRGGRNLRRLRSVLDEFGSGEGIDESELEQRMRRLFTRSDLPPIKWEAGFPGRDAGARRVDGLIEAWRVVLDGDGRAWHARIDDFERDRRRDQAAAAAGYLTLRYSYHQIVNEPAWCLDILRETGAQRQIAA